MHEKWLQSIASAILHEEYLNPVSESVNSKNSEKQIIFFKECTRLHRCQNNYFKGKSHCIFKYAVNKQISAYSFKKSMHMEKKLF